MEIQRFSGDLYEENTYLVLEPQSRLCVLIDPGRFVEALPEGYTLDKILLTHAHVDHALHAQECAERFSAPVYLHRADLPLYRADALSLFAQAGSGAKRFRIRSFSTMERSFHSARFGSFRSIRPAIRPAASATGSTTRSSRAICSCAERSGALICPAETAARCSKAAACSRRCGRIRLSAPATATIQRCGMKKKRIRI